MDENYNMIPHGVNFQDAIFPDTPENHRMFASLFQFSNCTPGTQVHSFTPEWEAQEDSRVRGATRGIVNQNLVASTFTGDVAPVCDVFFQHHFIWNYLKKIKPELYKKTGAVKYHCTDH